jgi:phage terminase large subunit GpA-like protein
MFSYFYPGGNMRFATLGSITSVKSNNIPKLVIEEPDDAPDNVKNQGSLLKNLEQRQKTVPKTQKKLVFGGTPTNKDFSRVEDAIKMSNQMIFKAKCHECGDLIPLTGEILLKQLKYEDYQDRYIDDVYGKSNPASAYFECPSCRCTWSFQQKTDNILEGKKYGFVDHTGNFSKGWHPIKPDITDRFGFILSELLSTMEDGSGYQELAKDKILADKAAAKGDEAELKSYYNNRAGLAYASGISAI